MKPYRAAAFFLVFVVIFSVAAEARAGEKSVPGIERTSMANAFADISQENILFKNGDLFWISRFNFLETSDKPFVLTLKIPGNQIEMRYTDGSGDEKKWNTKNDEGAAAKSTLFVSTDKFHIILGVPAVYYKQDDYGTLKVAKDLEKPVEIVKGDGFYILKASFPQDARYIGEIWGLQSANSLLDWNERLESRFMSNELADGRRISMDGYYFQTPSGYKPGGPDILFRHPASYTGANFASTSGSNAEYDLGYAIMKLAAKNQNELGYYPLTCESTWLKADFNIGVDYYDTRWNSDFALGLLDAYKAYGDDEFLERLQKYADFYLEFAEKNSYKTGDGILVNDYWQPEWHKTTHVSLNHHLAELNVLLRLYDFTKEERYRVFAERMLLGIEETESKWILSNGNLAYALYYTGKANVMVDYPYLTYNDLFYTRELLRKILSVESGAIQRLMDSKLEWMTKNGVTGYRTY